jgi:acetyl esterase
VAGDSAGGNLSAVVCQLAKAQDGPKIAHQLLMFPSTHVAGQFASMREFAEGYLLEKRSIDWFFGQYIPPEADISDPRISPLLAPDLSKLPPATVMLGGCDPLHDEGLAYAEKLRAAGVPVVVEDYPGMIHCFIYMQAVIPQAYEALAKSAKDVRRALGMR